METLQCNESTIGSQQIRSDGAPIRSTEFFELTSDQRSELESLEDPDTGIEHTTFSWSEDFQRHVLSALLHDDFLMSSVSGHIEWGHWTNEVHQLIYMVSQSHWKKYGRLPEDYWLSQQVEDHLGNRSEKQRNHFHTELNAVYHYYQPGVESRQAILDQLLHFARIQHSRAALIGCLEGMKDGKFEFSDTIKKLEAALTLGAATDTDCYDLLGFKEYAKSIERKYLVEEWLLAGSLTLFAGQQKLGKSTLMFSLLGSLLSGDRWLDKFDVTQSPVLYLDFENPADYVWENLIEYLPTERLNEVAHLFRAPKALPSALTADWLKRITEKHRLADQTGLLIVDSGRAAFNQMFGDVPNWENSQGPVRSALEPLQKFARQSGWAVVVVHHDNRSGGFSGSTDWEAVPDYIWRLERTKDGRKFAMRGRLKTVPNAQVIQKTGDRIAFAGSVSEIAAEEAEICQALTDDQILKLLPIVKRADVTASNGMTVKQLADLSGMPDSSVRRHLNRLLEVDPETGRRVSIKQLESTTGRPPKVYFREPMLAV